MNKDDFVFGTRAVIEAIKNNRNIEKIFLKKGLKNELSTKLFQLIREEQIPFQFVPIEKINRITRKNHQGNSTTSKLFCLESMKKGKIRLFLFSTRLPTLEILVQLFVPQNVPA